jgi:hypothetical protein
MSAVAAHWIIIAVVGLLALCGLAVWVVLYTASQVREKEREACAASSSYDENDADADRGPVQAYAVQVDPAAASALQPRKQQSVSVLATCAQGGARSIRLVSAQVAPESIAWLPLVQTRESMRLHQDVFDGRVRNLLIRGVVVRAWAAADVLNAIMIGRLPNDNKALLRMPTGCSPLPVSTPFQASSQSTSSWTRLVKGLAYHNGGHPILLSIWGF